MIEQRRTRRVHRWAVPMMLASAVPSAALAAAASGSGTQAGPVDPTQEDILIIAPRIFGAIRPERDLDPEAIRSYGVSTIDELIVEVQRDLGADDKPVIFVNGQRLNDLNQIGALPVEALRNVNVLPRGSGVRAGAGGGQRVINITLKPKVRSATFTGAHKIATDGHWHAERGEAILTSVHGQTRANLALRVRDDHSLLESDRGIVQPASAVPFAIGGNVIGFPAGTGEIDPLLSALAGKVVTVAPVPLTSQPTLAEFAAHANLPAITDLGRYRTLRPDGRTYNLSGTFATRLAPWLTADAALELNRARTVALRGLPTATFVLPAANPASPFKQDVQIAAYGTQPLTFRTRQTTSDANVTFDAEWGSWSGNLNLRHTSFNDVSRSQRQTAFGVPASISLNPFTTDFTTLLPVVSETASLRLRSDIAQLLVTGPLLSIPAGDVQGTAEGRLALNRLRSRSDFGSSNQTRLHRSEESIRGQIVVPITSAQNHILPALGDLSASAEYARVHDSDLGGLNNYGLAAIWDPRPPIHIQAEVRRTQVPATLSILGDPTIVSPGVRYFDTLTGQTVDVTQIFGGNPQLRPETDKLRRVSASLRLIPRINLQANAEYADLDRRNFLSPLPAASAAIMLAFPDRFIRDLQGRLTTIDLRPVNFQSEREKRLRWGASLNAKLAGGAAAKGTASPRTYLQLTANHSVVFSDRILIRPGLPGVDLLQGGAIGIASGRVRHQLDATAAITSGGVGVRAGVTWRGGSSLVSRIGSVTDTLRFSPLASVDVRAFADGTRVLPHSAWAKGLRLSLDVLNIANDRQAVRDSAGNTPLQYQPGYRDPIGRTVELELRKVF